MPELPEVETVCRIMRRVLIGHCIAEAEIPPDQILLSGLPPDAFVSALQGRTVKAIGRKGKFWWIELDSPPVVFGHLGMTGWIRELGAFTTRLREHGEAPLDDEAGRPRFLKMMLTTEEGKRIAFTDGRRLGRLWLGENPETDSRVKRLGFDALDELPRLTPFSQLILKRKAPIKAVLLDQTVLSGLGNWLADEVLYQSRIAPQRIASSLSEPELEKLRKSIRSVVQKSVDVGANDEFYPNGWLFHVRWGGSRGTESIAGKQIVREQVAGRTTAWVPGLQK
jgi:formamidopyrimidine-DNA glycosylase